MSRAEKVVKSLGFRITDRRKSYTTAVTSKVWVDEDFYKALLPKMKRAFPEFVVDRAFSGVHDPPKIHNIEGGSKVTMHGGSTFSNAISVSADTFPATRNWHPDLYREALDARKPIPNLLDGDLLITTSWVWRN